MIMDAGLTAPRLRGVNASQSWERLNRTALLIDSIFALRVAMAPYRRHFYFNSIPRYQHRAIDELNSASA
jgi:hypothetical protein